MESESMVTGIGDEVVGREAEAASLSSFLDDIPAGPVVLLLEGEPGIGKTTLLKTALDAARDRSYRVLASRPVESEAKLSFAALGDLLSGVADEALPSIPGPQARALDVALLRAEPEGAPPDNRAVSLAVLAVIQSLVREAPVLVAIDDVQWLDSPTARVLEFGLRRLETEPVGVLLARRQEGADGAFGLERILSPSRFRSVSVGPLPVDSLGELLRVRLGAGFLRPTLTRLHQMSGGNPFYAVEIARASLRGDRPATGQLLPIPQNLRDLTQGRMAGLPEETREALLVAAGLSAPTETLIESASSGADARGALARAVEAGVVEIEGGKVRFAHPLFASAIYSGASPEERRGLHRRLAGLNTDPEERARHLALSAGGPDAEVAAALEDAARRARARGAPDAAAQLAEAARQLTPAEDGPGLRRRMMAASTYWFAAGESGRARGLAQDAVEASPPGPLRAEAFLRLGSIEGEVEGWLAADELFTRGLAEAENDPALRASLERGIGYASLFEGDLERAEAHAQTALALDEARGDEPSVAESAGALAYVQFLRGKQGAQVLIARALELERMGESRIVVSPSYVDAQLRKMSGDLEGARSGLSALLRRAREQGEESVLPPLHAHLAELECRAGNWVEAERHAVEAETAARQTGQPMYLVMALFARSLVDGHLGRDGSARAATAEALAVAKRTGMRLFETRVLSILGFLDLSAGDHREAARHLKLVDEQMASYGIVEPAFIPFQPDAVQAFVATGELDRAASLVDRFERRGRKFGRTWALAAAARCRGLIAEASGDLDGALRAMRWAVQRHSAVAEPFSLARTLLVMGRIQRRARLKREARESLERAKEIFDHLGATQWSRHVEDELSRIGGRAPAPLALTPTEERVAALVAWGRTNREVADALFMTVNTVEWNLSKIYRKLGLRSRSELASRLAGGPGPEARS